MSQKKADTITGIPTPKMLLWISIVSMIMLFAGLTSGYIVRQAEGNWLLFDLPKIFLLSTILIMLSSISMQLALRSIKKGNNKTNLINLMITLGLGLGFCFTQFMGWSSMVDQGVFFVGNPSGSFLYVITGLHLAHLAGGIICLIVIITKSILERYDKENYMGISLTASYWHFLDILWVYLFVFLSIMR